MRKALWIALAVVIASFALAAYFYPLLPERLASHWNAQGQVDGYWGKTEALFIIPLISLGLLGLFAAIPKIDPLRKNIQEFRKYFDVFVILIMLFLLYVFALTIFWNLGYSFNIVQFLAPAFGILFFAAGVLIKHARQNWSIGIRTPWTLSSEKVWNKTHEKGGLLFKLSGIIAVFGVFLPEIAILLVLAPIILSAIYLFAYSYFEFKKENRKGIKLGLSPTLASFKDYKKKYERKQKKAK